MVGLFCLENGLALQSDRNMKTDRKMFETSQANKLRGKTKITWVGKFENSQELPDS